MDKWLLEQLKIVTPEEQAYLNGDHQIKKDIYTCLHQEDIACKMSKGYAKKEDFEIDCQLFLKEGKLLTVRHHSRFVEFPVHKHNYIEIVYVCAGKIIHCIDGKELVMETGDMLFMNQHVEHSVKKAEAEDIGINFIALPEFFDIPLQMMGKHNVIADFLVGTLRQNHPVPQYLMFQLEEQKPISNLMENMISSIIWQSENEDVINQYSMGLVFLYLINHMDRLTRDSSQNYEDVLIQATLKYIDTQYKTANLGRIAEDFHQSLPVLSKLIKKHTGYTFQELLLRKRFQKAVMFLIETELSVEEIATQIGYENLSYFYRQFKIRCGMTPSNYRKCHKNDKIIKI